VHPLGRIGLYGGSFNPIHAGHLLVAQAAQEELQLDRIYFVPTARSPFKPDQDPAPDACRLRWLRLALAGRSEWEVDPQEITRGGISYTIDTVRDYRGRFAGAELFYLIGADHLAQLPQWREAATLARLAQFVVIPRPGQVSAELPPPFQGRMLKGFPMAVSSSEVRARVKAGLPIDLLTPQGVAEDIRNNGLYL
jgi:nicotinate-nucleotide adenylyltransferase